MRVFIIDDSPTVCVSLEKLLTQKGYDVFCAKDGMDALLNVKQFDPDLIILDIMLPSIDGWQLCERFKNDDDLCHIPIIMQSSLDGAGDRQKCLSLGAKEFFIKPSPGNDFSDLMAAVERISKALS